MLKNFDLKKTDDCSDFYICELRFIQKRTSYMGLSTENKQIGYSRLHLFRKGWTIGKLRVKIFEIVRPLINNKKLQQVSDALDVEAEYKSLFHDYKGSYNTNNQYYDIEIHNNLPSGDGYFSKSQECDFCGKVHTNNCLFAYDDDVTLDHVLQQMKYDRELELDINWKPNTKAALKKYEDPTFEKVNLNNPAKNTLKIDSCFGMGYSKNLNIYDCLTYFSQEETLAGDNKWYCSKCKDHVPAFKKMEIYKVPEILVLCFKRFSHTRNSLFGSRKINSLIDFPVQGLDLTQYVLSGSPLASQTLASAA